MTKGLDIAVFVFSFLALFASAQNVVYYPKAAFDECTIRPTAEACISSGIKCAWCKDACDYSNNVWDIEDSELFCKWNTSALGLFRRKEDCHKSCYAVTFEQRQSTVYFWTVIVSGLTGLAVYGLLHYILGRPKRAYSFIILYGGTLYAVSAIGVMTWFVAHVLVSSGVRGHCRDVCLDVK